MGDIRRDKKIRSQQATQKARRRARKNEKGLAMPVVSSMPSVGDEITLRWTKYPGVPYFLSGSRAVVVAVTRKTIVVRAGNESADRVIHQNQVLRITRRHSNMPAKIECPECRGDGEVSVSCAYCGSTITNDDMKATDGDDDFCAKCAKED